MITDDTNVFDMMQTYAVEIASAGDSRTAGVNAVDGERPSEKDKLPMCPYCNRGRHTEADCHKKKRDQKVSGGKGGGKGGDSREEKRECYKCHKRGHIARNCPHNADASPVALAQKPDGFSAEE